jgi:hypothetical protein
MEANAVNSQRSWAQVVVRDVQFWIPVAVLVAGLVVLTWVAGQ